MIVGCMKLIRNIALVGSNGFTRSISILWWMLFSWNLAISQFNQAGILAQRRGRLTPLAFTVLEQIGISRVSFGPFIFRSCLRKFANIADELHGLRGYECFGKEMMSGPDTNAFLTHEVEWRRSSMHITILTVGMQEDNRPFVALGLGLEEKGSSVALATHSIFGT